MRESTPPPPTPPPPPPPASPEPPPPAVAPPPAHSSDPSHDDDLLDILARLGAEGDTDPIDVPTAAAPASGAAPTVGAKLTDPRDLTRPSSASNIVVDVGAGIDFDPTFASFGERAVGAIIDTLIVNLAVLPGVVLLLLGDSVATALLGLLVALLGVLAVIVLGARAIAKNGKWIGNRVANTTVVDAINGSFIDGGRAALRMFARHLISPILLFGYLVAFTDGQRRTFHDRLAGTVVIRRAREVWTSDDA